MGNSPSVGPGDGPNLGFASNTDSPGKSVDSPLNSATFPGGPIGGPLPVSDIDAGAQGSFETPAKSPSTLTSVSEHESA